MEAQRLDDLAREIGSQLPRRGVLGALGGLAALLALPALNGEAKKKHGKPRRGRKKCKGNKKKCGKKCIPTDQCCTTADCGKRGECVGGACVCPAGKKSCNGGCIPNDSCCQNSDCGPMQTCVNGACTCSGGLAKCGTDCIDPDICCGTTCPGNQLCDGGSCVCPNPDDWPCGDGSCMAGSECCVNANCPAGQRCDDGTCWCDAADGIWCDDACCDPGENQVCNWNDDSRTCAGGGCQLFDWCNVEENSVCRNSADEYCVCITSYEASGEIPACVNGFTIGDSCESCATSDECDDGYVCVQGDASGAGVCGCPDKFCARSCDAEPADAPRRESAGARSAVRKKMPDHDRERHFR